MYSLKRAWGDLSVGSGPLSVYVKSFQGHWLPTPLLCFFAASRVFSVLSWELVTLWRPGRSSVIWEQGHMKEESVLQGSGPWFLFREAFRTLMFVCKWEPLNGLSGGAWGRLGSWSVMVEGSSVEPSFAKAVHASLGTGEGSGRTSWQYTAVWLPPISSQVGNKIHEGKSWASIAQLGECSPSVTVTCVDMHATLELRKWKS